MDSAGTIDDYVAGFPPETWKMLERLRALINASARNAEESISYAIPTFDLNGHRVHFAGHRNHIGFYPRARGIATFKDELKSCKTGKDSVQLPLDQAMPMELIRRIVEFRVEENTRREKK